MVLIKSAHGLHLVQPVWRSSLCLQAELDAVLKKCEHEKHHRQENCFSLGEGPGYLLLEFS